MFVHLAISRAKGRRAVVHQNTATEKRSNEVTAVSSGDRAAFHTLLIDKHASVLLYPVVSDDLKVDGELSCIAQKELTSHHGIMWCLDNNTCLKTRQAPPPPPVDTQLASHLSDADNKYLLTRAAQATYRLQAVSITVSALTMYVHCNECI